MFWIRVFAKYPNSNIDESKLVHLEKEYTSGDKELFQCFGGKCIDENDVNLIRGKSTILTKDDWDTSNLFYCQCYFNLDTKMLYSIE